MGNVLTPELEKLHQSLRSNNSTLVLSTLDELDSKIPTTQETQILQKAAKLESDPILLFQLKKSFRIAAYKLQNKLPNITTDLIESLLQDITKLDDLAIAITLLKPAEAFLVTDTIRQSNWSNFPTKIIPNFCKFFKNYGNLQDSEILQSLTRHTNPTVISSAVCALESIDPTNLQSIIVPLISSSNPILKGQAIQSLYKWDKAKATQCLVDMMFSPDETEIALGLHHAVYFPYEEMEPHLLRIAGNISKPAILMRVSQIFRANAHKELPFKLFWVARSLQGVHQKLIKGILMGVVRELVENKMIDCSGQEFLNQLSIRVKNEELELMKKACNVKEISPDDGVGLPSLSFLSEKEKETVSVIEDDLQSTQSDASIPDLDSLTDATNPEQPLPEKTKTRVKKPPLKKKKENELNFSDYNQLPLKARTKLLRTLSYESYQKNHSSILKLLNSPEVKEVVAAINLIAKFGSVEDSDTLKPMLKLKEANIVSAAIRALSKLNTEHLCIYLPQLMQNRNGKIRMTATRAFMGIDRESIKSLLSSMMVSTNSQQRALAISSSMLVDFNLIRDDIVEALQKEKSIDLIEDIGTVISANPDRELLNAVYYAVYNSSPTLRGEKEKILISLSETLSIALGKISTPEELLEEAKQAYDELIKKHKEEKIQKEIEEKKKIEEINKQQVTVTEILTDNSSEKAKTKRASISFYIFIIAAILWAIMFTFLFIKYFL